MVNMNISFAGIVPQWHEELYGFLSSFFPAISMQYYFKQLLIIWSSPACFPLIWLLALEKPKEIEMLFLTEEVDFFAVFIKQVQ